MKNPEPDGFMGGNSTKHVKKNRTNALQTLPKN